MADQLADITAWNKEFEKLNNIPYQKTTAYGGLEQQQGTQSYYKKIMGDNQAAGGSFYKEPTVQAAPTQSAPGLMTPKPTATGTTSTTLQQGMGVNVVNGQYSFDNNASPAVSSAPANYMDKWTERQNNIQPSGQPDTSLYTLANQQRNTPVSQTATNFTGSEAYGTGTGPGGSYTFDDQARDRYGAANTNEWTANMANAAPNPGAPSPWADPMTEINRRLAERGEAAQVPAGGGSSGAETSPSGLMTQASTTNTVAPVNGKVGYEARQLADPTKWNVTDDQTVSGQVRKLIDENNPLQQQAATRARQQMNAGGLMNSSMAVQAGQAAMYDAALPIAQADAGTYGRAAAYNADTENQFAGKNVDASNAAYGATANIRANTARDTAATIAQANLADKQGNISAAAAEKLAGVNAQTAAKLAQTNAAAAVLKAQNDISLAAAGAVNEQTLTNLKANLQKAQIGQEQTVLMARELSNTINSINMNKDLDVNGKTAQIDKAIKAANNTFAAIYTVSQLTGTMLQFTKDEEESAPPPPPPPPQPSGSGLFGSNSGGGRNGIPPD